MVIQNSRAVPSLGMAFAFVASAVCQGDTRERGKLLCDRILGATFRFDGPLGERVTANLNNWLLRAPDANPGMIEMFRVRDRQPVPQLVPWAGEFVGKYLISAIQARRMVADPALDATIRRVIADLISTQADDGYLGPFRKQERLLGNWDLWGHYHCMLALMMWHEDTDDAAARQCAIRCADLICKTFLDTGKRAFDAGSQEMNLAVIHALGWLYRDTGNERYLRMMREIEKDWERAGDYFRQGLKGVDYYRTPRPRWESLHDVQGLVELYRITGNEDYKTAFMNLWRTIARYDRHNTGAFSTNEQAIGDPYTPGAIETCCSTAWMALTADMLRLTGEATVADELELSTWNTMLGSQHPSGRWWTYNTPMDGKREASAHTIVFQARAGTPELNCCSVNAPRGLGVLSEWGLMTDGAGLLVNYYGPMQAGLTLGGKRLSVTQKTAYPTDGHVSIAISPAEPMEFGVKLRIPAWSAKSSARVNGEALTDIVPGRYATITRKWQAGDTIDLNLDMSIRTWVGDGAALNKASLYYGPLLLAFDQHFNTYDTNKIPPMDLKDLSYSRLDAPGRFKPMVLCRFKGTDGRPLDLCDFATAGAYGTDYVSWLPVVNAPPPPFFLRQPIDGARIPPPPNRFDWTGGRGPADRTYTLLISTERSMEEPIIRAKGIKRPWYVVRDRLEPGGTYYWQVIASSPSGQRTAEQSPASFTVDASMPNPFKDHPALLEWRKDGLIAGSPLDGNGQPTYGLLEEDRNVKPAADRNGKEGGAVAFSGNGMLRYRIPEFPEDEYTFTAWACVDAPPAGGMAQIFSAWARGMDDPLRVTIQNGKVHARIEAGAAWSTKGAPITLGKWFHVAAVKKGDKLTLYVDGKPFDTVAGVPARIFSTAQDFALGGNPHFAGDEFLKGRVDDFTFLAKAMTPEEITAAYGAR